MLIQRLQPTALLSLFLLGGFFSGWAQDIAEDIETVISTAESYTGTPYNYNGIDCSRLMQICYQEVGKELPRTSYEQAEIGDPVSIINLRRGDMVFFKMGEKIGHVGIVISYPGEPIKFIHSSSSKGVTTSKMRDSYWSKRFVSARRLLIEALYSDPVSTFLGDWERSTYPGVYPESSELFLSTQDVLAMHPNDRTFMIKELLARHGYNFKQNYWKKYFAKREWYTKIRKRDSLEDILPYMSEREKHNYFLLMQAGTKERLTYQDLGLG
ncbi:MAG: C40 family peptidase [Bacteroidota bacterium]